MIRPISDYRVADDQILCRQQIGMIKTVLILILIVQINNNTDMDTVTDNFPQIGAKIKALHEQIQPFFWRNNERNCFLNVYIMSGQEINSEFIVAKMDACLISSAGSLDSDYFAI